MKIVITGSLGNVSKPLTQLLVQKGHDVTVISSNPERQKDIEQIGAKSAIGKMQDAQFLSEAFTGADVVYLMEAVGYTSFFDHSLNVHDAIGQIVTNYKLAIEQSGIKRVVHLSSIGAHTATGSGILSFHHYAESILQDLPVDVAIKFMRPVGFYYNMFAFIKTIKSHNEIIANYGGDDKEPWVSPMDIATTIAEEIEKPFSGRSVHYIAGDELSPNEIAAILGGAIGKTNLKWTVISDEQLLENLLAGGMNPQTADGFVAMNASRRGGVLYEDYNRHKPVLGQIKLTDFASDFAKIYNQS